MDEENRMEREIEDEIDAMPSVQDMDNDINAYDEYNLIVVPGQPQTQQSEVVTFTDDEEEEALSQRQRMPQPSNVAGGGTETIEIMSSGEENLNLDSDDDEEPPAADSSDDEKEAGDTVDLDSSSDDNKINYSTSDSDSDDGTENALLRSFEALLAEPQKEFAKLVKLTEIAFKLNDLDKIEKAIQILKDSATVPAHIWLKYLKVHKTVTHSAHEFQAFADKCATALSYHYNISLAEYIVGFLEDLSGGHQNIALGLKLMADYEIERPDFIERLTKREIFTEQIDQHCVTWKIPREERETINKMVSQFKTHLDNTKAQFSDWDWAKAYTQHVEEVLRLELNEDLKNALIRFIFERLVAKFPTSDSLWLAYMKFIQKEDDANDDNIELILARASRLGKGFLLNTVLDLTKRAVCCRPSVRLNHKLLMTMERADFAQAQVDEEINSLLKRIEPNMLMTVELYLDYLAFRIRNTNAGDEAQADNLRAAFFKVWEDLSNLYGDQADTSYEILQLWAQVEFTHLGNPANASNIWRQIMGYPGSSQSGMLWISYAQMDSEYNGGRAMRDIFREALAQPVLVDGFLVHEHFRRFERCFGTYNSIAACQAIELPPDYAKRVYSAPRQNRLLPRPQGQAKTSADAKPPTKGPAAPSAAASTEPQAQANTALNRQQRRRQAHEMKMGNKEQQEPKKAAPLPAAVTQPPAKPAAPEVRESYLKYSPHMETNKVFVRNLHPACTKEELQKLFQPFGHVKDVRLVRKQKQMRGIAYIEFEKPEDAQKAVTECNGQQLHGIKIMVAISNPPPKAGQTTPAAGDGGLAPKKRVLTSLIPTSVVRQEAVVAKKRRIDLAQNNDDDKPTTSAAFNGKTATTTAGSETKESAPKSNDDFRKLFLKESTQDPGDKTKEH